MISKPPILPPPNLVEPVEAKVYDFNEEFCRRNLPGWLAMKNRQMAQEEQEHQERLERTRNRVNKTTRYFGLAEILLFIFIAALFILALVNS